MNTQEIQIKRCELQLLNCWQYQDLVKVGKKETITICRTCKKDLDELSADIKNEIIKTVCNYRDL